MTKVRSSSLSGSRLEGKQINKAVAFMSGLYRAVIERDVSLVEINPLVVTGDGDLVALDAKMNFDSNAIYRQPRVAELRADSDSVPGQFP